MNEELKVIISAETSKLKKGVEDATKSINGFKAQMKKAGSNVDTTFKKAGQAIGKAIKAGCKVAIGALATVGTALAGFITASVNSFAEYEQLVGGVEKLFGDSAGTVQKYAQEAYKNAGISANDYMTQITSFSASLISSLGGDTAKAAEYGNMAINDMADNANVFGSSMEDIQNAYQGFAKQNYTMLDNLKLGYGGTKEEMMRLIDDANKVKEAMGENADLTIDSYADVIEAIHLVQNEMGITGTTAKEAEGTISGSIAMTKSAWQNLMTGLADGNANIPALVEGVISSATSVLENIIPVVKQIIQNIPIAISEISPEAGQAFQTIVDVIMASLPVLQQALETVFNVIVSVINYVRENTGVIIGVASAIGTVVAAIGLYNTVSAVKNAMDVAQVSTLGALISAKLASAAATLSAIAPYILIVAAIAAVIAIIVLCIKNWDAIKETVINVATAIWQKVQEMAQKVGEWFGNMKDAISTKIDEAKTAVEEKFEAIKNAISEKVSGAKTEVVNKFNEIKTNVSEKITAVKNTVSSIFEGIKTTMTTKIETAKTTVLNVFDAIKTGITNAINGAKQGVSDAIDSIKGFFNFSWSLPSIKMPHFSITGSFSLNPPSVPKFGIQWYAKGGVFDSPTLFGYGKGSIGGLGEAGAEAIVPLENNTKWLDKIAERLAAKQGNTPIVLTVDGKVFAQTIIDSLNHRTKQTGSLELQLY